MVASQHTNELAAIFSGTDLHHAYFIEGNAASVVPELFGLIESKLGIALVGNPDFWHLRLDVLTIDDARRLRERQADMAFGAAAKKIFIIETASITVEAQNALLKIFEEPTRDTHFFLMMPSRWLILPTVRSRLYSINRATEEIDDTPEIASAMKFLAAASAERLRLIAPILEEKNKSAAIALVNGLIARVYQSTMPKKNLVLEELLCLRGYLDDRAASPKLILEHLALVVPPLV